MRWVVVLLLGLVGLWMVFDGARAVLAGDYTTPKTGRHAGELGPWSRLVEATGIPARSTAMKVGFVLIGLLHVSAAVFLAARHGSSSGWAAVVAAVSGLWYLPFGTALDAAALVLIVTGSLRPW